MQHLADTAALLTIYARSGWIGFCPAPELMRSGLRGSWSSDCESRFRFALRLDRNARNFAGKKFFAHQALESDRAFSFAIQPSDESEKKRNSSDEYRRQPPGGPRE